MDGIAQSFLSGTAAAGTLRRAAPPGYTRLAETR
jgi:hypothetical protein